MKKAHIPMDAPQATEAVAMAAEPSDAVDPSDAERLEEAYNTYHDDYTCGVVIFAPPGGPLALEAPMPQGGSPALEAPMPQGGSPALEAQCPWH